MKKIFIYIAIVFLSLLPAITNGTEISSAIVAYTITSGSSNPITITSAGFGTPEAAIFFQAGTVFSDSMPVTDSVMSFGFTDGTNSWSNSFQAEFDDDGTITNNCKRQDSDCIASLATIGDGSCAVDYTATFGSWTTNGAVINVGTPLSYTAQGSCILLKGDNVDFKVGNFSLGDDDQAVSVTGVGFEPKGVILSSVKLTANGGSRHLHFSIGFIENTGDTVNGSICSQDNRNGQALKTMARNDSVLSFFVDNTSDLDYTVTVDSIDSDGFTVRAVGNDTGSVDVGYLAFGGDYIGAYAGFITTPASAESTTYTPTGVSTDLVLMIPNETGTINSMPSDKSAYGISAFNGTQQVGAFTIQDNGKEGGRVRVGQFQKWATAASMYATYSTYNASTLKISGAETSITEDNFVINFTPTSTMKWPIFALGTATFNPVLQITGANTKISYSVYDAENSKNGIEITSTASGTVLTNCTVARAKYGIRAYTDCTLTNVLSKGEINDIWVDSGATVTGTTNAFDDAAAGGSGTYTDTGATSFSKTISFTDESGGDFTLTADLQGTDYGYTLDLAGNAVTAPPSIGAYEYIASGVSQNMWRIFETERRKQPIFY